MTTGQLGEIQPVLSGDEIIEMQKLVTRVPVSDQVLGYAWALVRASRPGTTEAPDFVNKWVNWGAGPRGVLTLVTCAKARAILYGRYHATVADVQAVAKPALRHRIAGNYAAQAARPQQREADRHAVGGRAGGSEIREAGGVSLAPMNEHPNKHIRAAIEYALQHGWALQKSGPRAHTWGILYCRRNDRDGCRRAVYCTPRVPESHAKDIRRAVDRCPH